MRQYFQSSISKSTLFTRTPINDIPIRARIRLDPVVRVVGRAAKINYAPK